MGTIMRWLRWFWRGWPVLVVMGLVAVHLIVIHYAPANAAFVNKVVSQASQVVGGLLILYSINSNLGIISKKQLWSLLAGWWADCPARRRSVILHASGCTVGVSGGRVKITVGRSPKTTEERLDYLQEQIDQVKKDTEELAKDLAEGLRKEAQERSESVKKVDRALMDLGAKVEEVSVGGINEQFFGVLLVVYGAGAGLFA